MTTINPALAANLVSEGVDLDRMIRFLEDLNTGKYDDQSTFVAASVPDISHPSIIDRCTKAQHKIALSSFQDICTKLDISCPPETFGQIHDSFITLEEDGLELFGIHLYPKSAYGVLNGGSASSYADIKKNQAIDPAIFETYKTWFTSLAEQCRGLPKGITPAYINPDGSAGYSFLLLKLRMILEHKKRYVEKTGKSAASILRTFQMTSVHTDEPVKEAFRHYVMMSELKEISDFLSCPSMEMYTESQTMMAAITHSSEGNPRKIFDCAFGKENVGIAMPGGHGQNFEILAPIYKKMYAQGIRYVWLGNIDNMGFTVDPVSLALFALSGKDAAFDVAYRTPLDVKGGILAEDSSGKLSCADIGPAISYEKVLKFEASGKRVLFNCGVGLFDLEKLIPMLDTISFKLPLRISDQDKDSGKYAQAEQITWEIIGLLKDPLFFAVEKSKRFIAAKMLMETILTSIPPSHIEGNEEHAASAIAEVSRNLHEGLSVLLEKEYGLQCDGNRWVASFAK